MNAVTVHRWTLAALAAAVLMVAPVQAQSWTTPTPEELHMTALADVPGAEAVMLNREETDDDDNHSRMYYYRIKVLSEGGIKLGDVELQYDKRSDSMGTSVQDITGRTIQPDGTVVPFTGKPHDKLLYKDKENAFSARVFSMPAVQVGSIIEYRYYVRWDDHAYSAPDWIVQSDLFLRSGRFHWKPTDKELSSRTRGGRENISNRITWAQSLPKGTDVKMIRQANQRLDITLNVANVMPFGNEEFMPPIRSSRYHVFFYYTPYRSSQEYWDTEVKYWNTDTGKFTKVSAAVQAEAQTATARAATDEDKARTLYADVMTFENTDYTRKRTGQEEKAEVRSAEDVVKRKRGSSDQIAMTYVALARAAGLQASVMTVVDRSNRIFDPNWMDFNAQLTDNIVVIRYGNAEHFLDPGSRYAAFGHLQWQHSISGGVRQDNPDPAKLFQLTSADGYKFSRTSRVADLQVQRDGHMSGTVTFTYDGNPALQWRHVALRNDEAELRDQLKKQIERVMPGGTEVEVETIGGLTNGEVPLTVKATVSGTIGNAVGSRVMLPVCLFEANRTPTFPHAKRDQGIYFPYSEMKQDAVRYSLPPGFTVEAPPAKVTTQYKNLAAYSQTASQAGSSITIRRDLILGDMYFPLEDYAAVRSFYNDFEQKDHGAIVIKRTADASSPASTAGQ
ncbi:MAG: DUF3857 domain-containing protein [Janthinobacterium lividum]